MTDRPDLPLAPEMARLLDAYSVPALPADFAERMVARALAELAPADAAAEPAALPRLPRARGAARPAPRRWLRGVMIGGGVIATGMLSISAAAMGFLGEPIRQAVHHVVHRVPVVGHMLERALPERPKHGLFSHGFFARHEGKAEHPPLVSAPRIAVPAPALSVPPPNVPPPNAPSIVSPPSSAPPPHFAPMHRFHGAALGAAGLAGAVGVHHWIAHRQGHSVPHFAPHWRREPLTPMDNYGRAPIDRSAPLGEATAPAAPRDERPLAAPRMTAQEWLAQRNARRAERGLPPLGARAAAAIAARRDGQAAQPRGEGLANPYRAGNATPGSGLAPLAGWHAPAAHRQGGASRFGGGGIGEGAGSGGTAGEGKGAERGMGLGRRNPENPRNLANPRDAAPGVGAGEGAPPKPHPPRLHPPRERPMHAPRAPRMPRMGMRRR